MASRFRLARLEAVSQSRSIGLVFDQQGGRWTFRVCADGNGNGIRRAEIASGTDACLEGPHDLQAMFPGVQIAVDATIRGPGGEPPSPAPVRFGTSNLASFSALGSTAGHALPPVADGRAACREAGRRDRQDPRAQYARRPGPGWMSRARRFPERERDTPAR